jgi:hypothetical protein
MMKAFCYKFLFACLVYAVLWEHLHAFPSKDPDGWTAPVATEQTRILYVSVGGDDSSGRVYGIHDPEIGSNPRTPVGVVQPFRTYSAAFQQVRNGASDWILFRRGEQFDEAIGGQVVSGLSPSEPFFVGTYGLSGASPVLRIGGSGGISLIRQSPSVPSSLRNIIIQGLRFYAHTRNPEDPAYLGSEGTNGLQIHAHNAGNSVGHILIEGCAFLFMRNNVIQSSGGAPPLEVIHLRRNVILNSYSENSHAQGVYVSKVSGFLLEENVFDHNGWLVQRAEGGQANGQATMYNHNVYMASVDNAHLIGNLFLRASSSGSKLTAESGAEGLIVRDNLYVDCETGIDACNNYHSNHYRISSPLVQRNVFYNLGVSRPTNRSLAWSIWMQGWDGGLVSENLFFASESPGSATVFNVGLRSRGVVFANNIVHARADVAPIRVSDNNDLSGIRLEGNRFVLEEPNNRLMVIVPETEGLHFENNKYQQGAGNPQFRIGNQTLDAESWRAGQEPNAEFGALSFPDDTRTIESYLAAKGLPGSIEAFYQGCRAQDMFSWNQAYSASEVNEWLRGGFFEETDNQLPVLQNIGSRSIHAGVELRIQIHAEDPDGDSLEYSASGE